jgi:hypothetical protein
MTAAVKMMTSSWLLFHAAGSRCSPQSNQQQQAGRHANRTLQALLLRLPPMKMMDLRRTLLHTQAAAEHQHQLRKPMIAAVRMKQSSKAGQLLLLLLVAWCLRVASALTPRCPASCTPTRCRE